jgi:hypothetical protein
MNKIIKVLIFSVLTFLVAIAAFTYSLREGARKEYEQAKAEYEAKPELPIEINYRRALMGPGLVVSFKNASNRHLAVVATFYNPTLKKEDSYRLDLAPQIPQEVGHAEGWAFASGDSIKIIHNEYKTKMVKLP